MRGQISGAIITPLTVPWITITWGWRWAFVITGALGFVWLAFWLLLYRKPEDDPRVSKAELDYIQQRSAGTSFRQESRWPQLLPLRQTWATW